MRRRKLYAACKQSKDKHGTARSAPCAARARARGSCSPSPLGPLALCALTIACTVWSGLCTGSCLRSCVPARGYTVLSFQCVYTVLSFQCVQYSLFVSHFQERRLPGPPVRRGHSHAHVATATATALEILVSRTCIFTLCCPPFPRTHRVTPHLQTHPL
jgi:hypothetical protein